MTDILTLRPWWANKLYMTHCKPLKHGYMEFTMRRYCKASYGVPEHAVVELRCGTWYLFKMFRKDEDITPPDQVIWFEPYPDDIDMGETNVGNS